MEWNGAAVSTRWTQLIVMTGAVTKVCPTHFCNTIACFCIFKIKRIIFCCLFYFITRWQIVETRTNLFRSKEIQQKRIERYFWKEMLQSSYFQTTFLTLLESDASKYLHLNWKTHLWFLLLFIMQTILNVPF